MDKTILDNYKAEEREKSNRLFRKLALLNIIHPPTEEFGKVFTNEMFLKPNDKAFFQVMYYLFNILDPGETRKRFIWPITDKKYEAMFRTASVSYINHLIEKYSIKWQPVKSYLVVKPGGMKFLTFLHDFIDFFIKELVKKNEKLLNIETRPEVLDLGRIKVTSRTLKAYAAKYASELDIQRDEIESFTSHLKLAFAKLHALTGITERTLCDSAFKKYFDDVNVSLCKSKFNKTAEMDDFYEKLALLITTLNEFISSKSSSYDSKVMEEVLAEMKLLFPDIEFTGNHSSDLITAYNQVFPFINHSHQNVSVQPRDMVDYENSELQRIRSETILLETELAKFTTEYLSSDGTSMSVFETPKRATNEGQQSVLQAKFMSTPILKFSMDSMKDMQLPPRMPFWDTSELTNKNSSNGPDISIDSSDSFMNLNQKTAFQVPVTVKKNSSNSVSKKSKFADPTQFLLSLKKDKSCSKNNSSRNSSLNTSAKNLSNLASKWKASSEPFLQPTVSKKNQNLTKLQSKNEALLNLSNSPSGRFESKFDNTPKIVVNDYSDTENAAGTSFSGVEQNMENANDSQKTIMGVDLSKSETSSDDVTKTEDGNVKIPDFNISNLCSAFQAQHLMDNNDSIFDISDTILNDVSDL